MKSAPLILLLLTSAPFFPLLFFLIILLAFVSTQAESMRNTPVVGGPIADAINNGDGPFGRPVNGNITARFGEQIFYGIHMGLDYGVATGSPIYATMPGEVVEAGDNGPYGLLVIIQNGDYKTYYAHLSVISIQVGQIVQPGQQIGLSGNTGRSTGPHLHYEIRYRGIQVDPCLYGAC
jgi:murein DD-endopeptidase MepM/ murein hydrolase activator NlpD